MTLYIVKSESSYTAKRRLFRRDGMIGRRRAAWTRSLAMTIRNEINVYIDVVSSRGESMRRHCEDSRGRALPRGTQPLNCSCIGSMIGQEAVRMG